MAAALFVDEQGDRSVKAAATIQSFFTTPLKRSDTLPYRT